MTEQTHSRPKEGDLVTVGSLPGVFTVESFDGSTYVLRSVHGVSCRAGVLVVKPAKWTQSRKAA